MSKTRIAIIQILRDLNLTPDKPPIIMFEIGIPLVIDQKIPQSEILAALDVLCDEGLISIQNNTLRLLKPLPEVIRS